MKGRKKIGESLTLESYFRRYYQALCYYASGLLKDDVGSEDVVQDVFLKIYANEITFQNEQHFRHYIYIAVRNSCISLLRIQQHNVITNFSDSPPNDISDSTSEDAEYWQQRSELLRRLNEAVEELPPRAKQIFLMAFCNNMKTHEISEALSISTNTVKVIKQRIKARMKTLLNDISPVLIVLVNLI